MQQELLKEQKKSQIQVGYKNNFLTVKEILEMPFVLCECDCGNMKTVRIEHLKSGHTKSCGCYQRKRTSQTTKTHGCEPKRLYSIWANMKTRCGNKNVDCYKNYGGRGITVCDEWQNFESFKIWALENGYQENLTIDRIDNNGNYEPSNCRWATDAEQRANTRRSHFLICNGRKLTIKQWSEILGISDKVIRDRVNRYGWSTEEALGFVQRRRCL